MNNLKIAVYAIAKNEEKFAERFCESCKDADYIVVADTGSTDQTVEKLKQFGATVYQIKITPWRFDRARDAALALVPQDADVCIALDLDEVMESGWREEIERVWVKGVTTRMRYKFDFGNNYHYYCEKIHARENYLWQYPIHEYICPVTGFVETFAQSEKILTSHHPDPTKSRGQYLTLLLTATQERPDCHRMAFYYARELSYASLWEEAITAWHKYLKMPTAVWDHERGYAMRSLAEAYKKTEKGALAQKWYRMAVAELPYTRCGWMALAQASHDWGLWVECYYAALHALHIKERTYTFTEDAKAWTWWPHDTLAIAAYHLGQYELAIEHGELAVSMSPEDERIRNNLKFYYEKLSK